MSEQIFDFGFTAVDETELNSYQKATQATQSANATQEKVDDLYNAIQPLLNNLKACLLYTSPSPRDRQRSRMPSSA